MSNGCETVDKSVCNKNVYWSGGREINKRQRDLNKEGKINVNPSEVLQCKICPEVFIADNDLVRHIQDKHQDFKMQFGNQGQLKSPQLLDDPPPLVSFINDGNSNSDSYQKEEKKHCEDSNLIVKKKEDIPEEYKLHNYKRRSSHFKEHNFHLEKKSVALPVSRRSLFDHGYMEKKNLSILRYSLEEGSENIQKSLIPVIPESSVLHKYQVGFRQCKCGDCQQKSATCLVIGRQVARLEGPNFFHCQICNKKFPCFSSLTYHVNKYHDDAKVEAVTQLPRNNQTYTDYYEPYQNGISGHKSDGPLIKCLDKVEKLNPVENAYIYKNNLLEGEKQKLTATELDEIGKTYDTNRSNPRDVKGRSFNPLSTSNTPISQKSVILSQAQVKKLKNTKHNLEMSESKKLLVKSPLITSNKKNTMKCYECDEIFTSSSLFEIHMQSHEKQAFKCEKCSRVYTKRNLYEEHLRSHVSSKSHCCPFCQRTFSMKGNLRRHIRIHTNEAPYECPICFQRFRRSDGLKGHVRRHEAIGESGPTDLLPSQVSAGSN